MMKRWTKPRGYQHLDGSLGNRFLTSVLSPNAVARHSWLPFLRYDKKVKRYDQELHKTVFKLRPIMYASHKDSAILSKYSDDLSSVLENLYSSKGLSDSVIAYRAIGKGNYDFAFDVLKFVKTHIPCTVICLDIEKYFDTLNHRYLKTQLKSILGCEELPTDWYAVFKAVTKFRFIELSDLKAHPLLGKCVGKSMPKTICSIRDAKANGIEIHSNRTEVGIPQGSPISAVLSNCYLLSFDCEMHSLVESHLGIYRRYSDDIVVVIPGTAASGIDSVISDAICRTYLRINSEKTDINVVNAKKDINFQYLGFQMSATGGVIRSSSTSRQMRKLKYGLKKIERDGLDAIEKGKATKIFRKRLWTRFVAADARNFPSYSRRAAKAFGSKRIARQGARLERRAAALIKGL